MSPTSQALSLIESEIISEQEERPGLTALAEIYLLADSGKSRDAAREEWQTVVAECEALLKNIADISPAPVIDSVAYRLAKLVNASYSAGIKMGFRDYPILQSRKASAAKQRDASRRWKIIRRAIVCVCRKQKLRLIASDAFAESIRGEVVEQARLFGLSDLRRGTSSRSIERHIAFLLRQPDLISAIARECE
jgi:hypothetical protein